MAINVRSTEKAKRVYSTKNDPLVQDFLRLSPTELESYIGEIKSIPDIKSVLRTILKHLYLLENR